MTPSNPRTVFAVRSTILAIQFAIVTYGSHKVFPERSYPVIVSGILLTLFSLSSAYVLSTKWIAKREAAALGARIVPEVKGNWPGNFDVLRIMIDKFKNGYPAEGLDDLHVQYGPAINMRIVWTDLMMTQSPEHIKLMLATNFQNFVKGERFRNNMASVLGVGVFNSDSKFMISIRM